MQRAASSRHVEKGPRRLSDLVGSFFLAYVIAAVLIGSLVYFGSFWNVLAYLRLLGPLVEAGILQYHDGNQGVSSLPSLDLYVASHEPIIWKLVFACFGLYVAYYLVKAAQFHGIGRFLGLKGNMGQHGRAYLYGDGLNRFFPHRVGEVAMVSALEGQGESAEQAKKIFNIQELLVIVFEVLIFCIWGLFVTNWATWIVQIFWALVIMGLCYLFTRSTSGVGVVEGARRYWGAKRAALAALMERPGTFLRLGFLGSLGMLLDDIAPYLMAMAFTGLNHVVLQVPFFVIQSAVVAGYIAKRIQFTPHGIGQYEWGFAMALYVSGIGFPESVTVALLDSAVRHITGTIVFLVIRFGYGVETNLWNVLDRFTGFALATPPAAAAVPSRAASAAAVPAGSQA